MNSELSELIEKQDLAIGEFINDVCDIIIEEYGEHNFETTKKIINARLVSDKKACVKCKRTDYLNGNNLCHECSVMYNL